MTPIIDPLAAITGAPANADLMSIPLQQAHLLTTQHDFAQRLDQTEHSLAELISHQEQVRQTHELRQHQALDSLRQEILALLRVLEANVVQQHDAISRKIQEKQHAAERDAQELSHQLAQETEIRAGIEQELQTTMTTLAAQMSQLGRSIEQIRAHVKQAQVERDRQREETEARWHRQQQEGLDQLRTQMTADLQQFVTSVRLQLHQHREELSLHYATLQRHLTDVEQRYGHAEGELVRLRRQQRLARRYRRAAST